MASVNITDGSEAQTSKPKPKRVDITDKLEAIYVHGENEKGYKWGFILLKLYDGGEISTGFLKGNDLHVVDSMVNSK